MIAQVAMWIIPRSMICAPGGQDDCGSMNCGRIARNSRNTFGFSPLMPNPLTVCRTHDWSAGPSPTRGTDGRANVVTPSQIR